jgi:hypothetical protein
MCPFIVENALRNRLTGALTRSRREVAPIATAPCFLDAAAPNTAPDCRLFSVTPAPRGGGIFSGQRVNHPGRWFARKPEHLSQRARWKLPRKGTTVPALRSSRTTRKLSRRSWPHRARVQFQPEKKIIGDVESRQGINGSSRRYEAAGREGSNAVRPWRAKACRK